MRDRSAQASPGLPVVDMTPLFDPAAETARAEVASAIRSACREFGFFYLIGHGVSDAALRRLETASREFFALPVEAKMGIAMAKGGKAWRGFFPLGGELTSGRPDIKEGLYFGSELPPDHPRVQAGWPLHGQNLWHEQVPDLRAAVLDYMAMTVRAAHVLMEGMALSLGLEPRYFARHYTSEPTVLFRIFHYPAITSESEESWGVGEHTDYGLLTLLAQDENSGLQVKTPGGWIDAPPLPGTLVCNIGDMLDRLTGGWFRSTPHRVRNLSGRDRLSFPLFFDPDFAAEMRPLPQHFRSGEGGATEERWDGADLQAFQGTYGNYLLGKISKVFPELGRGVL